MKAPAVPASDSTGAPSLHERRVRRMLLLGSGLTAVFCVGWGTFFSLHGNRAIAALDLVCILLSALTFHLVQRGRIRQAARLLSGVLYGVMTFNAAYLDVPSLGVPRSAHAFLLGYAVVAVLLMRDEPPWLRHGVPLLFLCTYAVLASSNAGPQTAFMLPDSVRAPGVWINHGFVVALVYGALWIIQADVALRNGQGRELERALLQGELLLYLQPQVGEDGRILGAEALLRWQHPQRGMVSPGEFIPLAERSGLMPALGDWVLRTACLRLAAWRLDARTAGLQLAVNVSASQFTQPDFVARVLARVAEAGIDPSMLKLELTESVLAEDLDAVVAKMAVLKAHGIGFSLDDFGTGFSSLSYLRRLPLDQLKIDQSFVRNMLASPNDAAIAQTVVALGRTLGLQVIAEGVETDEQRSFLCEMGCEAFQGYLFSRPVPPAEFEAQLHGAWRPLVPPASTPMAGPAEGARDRQIEHT